ncbi:unnamed protein product [Plutella xylostella]|uniref:Regulatory protein zeste n=1 Tax=Plutella xylostella TaxID=51655 RepID=A0A8S4F8M6_PLUXY|nr:unnamed protein product [Plutella xylostella]
MEQKDLNNPPTTSTLSGKKRARSENWVEEDKILLRELVKERVHALENKNTDTNTNAKKLNAWADLMLSFNSMCKGSPRKLAQLKTQWTGQKMDEKKKKGNVRREMLKTGGGPPPPSEQCDPDDIESWLPHEFTVDTCEGDSDFLHQYETVQVNILDEHAITTTDAIENKISVIDEDTLLRICTSAFSNDEIQKSKSLLFDAVPTTKRKIQRKKEGKGHRDLEDIMSLFKSVPAEVMPVFVSRELEKLPPVTFDHLDCTQLLKDIVRLQAEINNIKETYVTSTQLQEFKSELQVKNNSPLLPICSVNTGRGAWCLDSGPIGLSQCDIASVNDSLDTITKTPTSTKAMKDSSPNSNISEQHTVAVDNTKSTHKLDVVTQKGLNPHKPSSEL